MSLFDVGARVQHLKYGLATVAEISPSGIRVRFDAPPADLDGEAEDTVCAEDLQSVSPYSNNDVIQIIIDHLNVLFDPDDRICLTFIHSFKKTSNGAAVTENFCIPLKKAITKTSIARMQLRNDEGFNVYVAMNPLLPGADRRRKELAGDPRTVFMEVDENGDKVLSSVRTSVANGEIPKPTVILRSSPGKYQFMWRIDSSDFTLDKVEAVNESLVSKFGADPASTDRLRVFRVPALRNMKYPDRPVVSMVEAAAGGRHKFSEFKISVGEVKSGTRKSVAAESQLSAIVGYFEEAAAQANIRFDSLKKWGDNGYLWEITCPWVAEHTGQKDSGSVVILHKSGALDFVCQHGHCVERTWPKDFRPKLEELVGHSLRFGDPVGGVTVGGVQDKIETTTVAQYAGPTSDGAVVPVVVPGSVQISSTPLKNIDVVSNLMDSQTLLPPFDTRIIKGFYSDLVGLVTAGNTLPPQFIFGVGKTIVGLRCAGRTVFEGCDKQPRFYFMMIGETGVGKGESWRRTMNVLTMNNSRLDFDQIMSVFNSADSGAGLKEAFFDKAGRGTGVPVALYIDEIMDLGAKTRADRNPEILSTMLELANGNSLSRIKANTKWTCNNAKLSVLMCAQPALISVAFAGMRSGELGWYDRISPEIAYPQEIDDVLRPVDSTAAMKVSLAFDALPYESAIKESSKALELLKEYRATWSKTERAKARRLDHMKIDMNMLAFGRRSPEAEQEDALAAIYLDQRQQTIREQYFGEEVPDRVGDYSRRIKAIIKGQILALRTGVSPEGAMLSERDFMAKTNAYRKNEEVYFKKAWMSIADTLLKAVEHDNDGKRGPKTKFYLPK